MLPNTYTAHHDLAHVLLNPRPARQFEFQHLADLCRSQWSVPVEAQRIAYDHLRQAAERGNQRAAQLCRDIAAERAEAVQS